MPLTDREMITVVLGSGDISATGNGPGGSATASRWTSKLSMPLELPANSQVVLLNASFPWNSDNGAGGLNDDGSSVVILCSCCTPVNVGSQVVPLLFRTSPVSTNNVPTRAVYREATGSVAPVKAVRAGTTTITELTVEITQLDGTPVPSDIYGETAYSTIEIGFLPLSL